MISTRTASFIKSIVIIIIFITTSVFPNESNTTKSNTPFIIISVPVDASSKVNSKWFGDIIEQLLHFRISANKNVKILSSEKLYSELKKRNTTPQNITTSEYIKLAKEIGATHILQTDYEIKKDNKSCQVVAEITELAEQKKDFGMLEQSFSLENTPKKLDSIAFWFTNSINLPHSKELSRFNSFPVLTTNIKELRKLGNLIELSKSANKDSVYYSATKLTELVNNDADNLLADYVSAQAYFKSEDYLSAAKSYKGLITIIPNHAGLYVRTCKSFRLAKRYSDALAFAQSAEKKNIKSIDMLVEGGLSLEALARNVTAEKVFNTVLKESPYNSDALLFFARNANKKRNYKKAKELAEKILQKDKSKSLAFLELGISQQGLKNYKEAIKSFKEAEKYHPNNIRLQTNLANCYTIEKEYLNAAKHYEKLLALNQKKLDIYLKIASSYENSNKLKKSLLFLSKAERAYPDSLIIQKKIGLIMYSLSNTSGATLHLQRYVDKGKEDADVFMTLGTIYNTQKKFDKAFFMFSHAMPIVKEKNSCRRALAELYLAQGNPNAAITHLLEITRNNANYPKAMELLADAWFEIGTISEALTCYKKARSINNNVHIQQRIANINFENKDFKNAQIEYTRLLKMDPKNTQAYFKLAIIALTNKDPKKAKEYIAKGSNLGNPGYEILLRIAKEYDKLNIFSQSIKTYKAVLKEKPNHEETMILLANAYLEKNNKKEASDLYIKLFDINKNEYSKYLSKAGFLLEKNGDTILAEQVFTKFINNGYTNPNVNLHLAKIVYSTKNYKKVIDLLSSIDTSFLQNSKYLKILGVSYFKEKKYLEASQWLAKANLSGKQNLDFLKMLAISNEKTDKITDARKTYQKILVLANSKEKANYAFHIGELFEKENKKDDAVKQYKKNIMQYIQDTRSYNALANMYLEWNDLASARKILEVVTKFKTTEPIFKKKLAKVYLMQNDKLNAVRQYKKYLKDEPNDFDAWIAVAGIYFDKKVYSKAAYAYKKATDINPKDVFTWHRLGICYKNIGKITDAIIALNKAHNLKPNEIKILENLADCYRIQHHTTELISSLLLLMNLESDNFNVKAEYGKLLIENNIDINKGIAILEQAVKLNGNNPDVRIILAKTYEKLNNNTARYAHLKNALEKNPSNPKVLYENGRYFASVGKLNKAEQLFAKAIIRDPKYSECMFEYSLLLFKTNRVAEAYAQIQNAVQFNSYEVPYLVHFAKLSWELGKKDQATQIINSALSLDSTDINVLSLAGHIYKENNDIDESIKLLSKGISLHPECASCYIDLGDIYFNKMRYVKAAGYYSKALNNTKNKIALKMKLANCYRLACQDNKAKEYYKDILVDNPNEFEAFYRLAHILITSGDIESARTMLKKRIKGKKTVWHHMVKGELQEVKGNIDEAMISFKVALRLSPNLSEAYAGIGRINIVYKKYNQAIVDLGKALANDPYNQYILLNLGTAYEGIGEYNSAYEIYHEVSSKYPQVAQAYYQLSNMKNQQKEYMQAIEIAKKGLETNPNNQNLLIALADAYRLNGQYQMAADTYLKTVKQCKNKCLIIYSHLVNLYSKHLNKPKEAQKYAKKYVKAGGDKSVVQVIK